MSRGPDQAKSLCEERLEWLVFFSAYVAHSRDGDMCWVMMRPDRESDFETVPGSVCPAPEQAIDAAREWKMLNP